MKLNGKGIAILAGTCIMALIALIIVGVSGAVTTTNDTDNVMSMNGTINEADNNISADVAAAEQILLRFKNPGETQSGNGESAAETEDVKETEPQSSEAATEAVTEPETEEPSPYANKFMVNVTEYLNIRAEASQDSQVVGKLYPGSGGDVLERGAEWTKISSGSVEGYVANQYIVFGAEAEAKANEVGKLKVTVLTDSLRIRKTPSTESGIWELASEGEVFDGIGYDGEFMGIYYDGEIAFLSLDYVNVELVIKKAISIEEEQEQIRLAEEAKRAEEEERLRKEQEANEAMERAARESQYVETVKTSAYNISESDVYLLACLVMAEAGYEPYEGKLAVANVVLNRLSGGAYGSTMSDVIYARGQFSVAASGRLATVLSQGPNSESVRAAEEAISGVNNVPNYANFCALYVANYSRYNNYTIIGNQVFYN